MPKYINRCPPTIDIDIYNDCSFNCVYCIGKEKHFDKTVNFDEIIKKLNSAPLPPPPVYISPWTDPYQNEEKNKGYTHKLISFLASHNFPFFVITKGTGVLRDYQYFINRDNSFIAISLNCLNYNISRIFEPEAPSPQERIELVDKLISFKKIKVVIKIDPIIPEITDGNELEKLLSQIIKIKPYAVTAETLRLSEKLAANLKNVMSYKNYKKTISFYNVINSEYNHPGLDYRKKLFSSIADKLSKNKIRASFCQSSLPIQITSFDCRGGY